jgi:hypothetical protein
MPTKKWNTEENEFLMSAAHKLPWETIATTLGRSEAACKAHFEKIRKLRIATGHWKGIEV